MLVYVLFLAGGHYYVGRVKNAADFDSRLAQHKAGEGAQWTKLHAVEDVYELIEDAAPTDEDARVIALAAEFGIDKVRGGTFCTPVLAEADAHVLGKMMDSTRGTCYHCHQAGHVTNECPITLAMATQRGGDWICPECGDDQFGRNTKCNQCDEPRPDRYTPVTRRAGWKPGDWECTGCGDHQFAKNPVCKKCGARKPAVAPTKRPRPVAPVLVGVDAPLVAEPPEREVKKPRIEVTVKSGDWPCPACSANNFASRQACFKCKKVRPTAETAIVANCVVCLDKQAKVAMIPCGHLCACQVCAATIATTNACPMCRAIVTGQNVIFQ